MESINFTKTHFQYWIAKKYFSEAFVESGEEGEVPEFEIDPYQEITFNAGYGMRTTLQSVVDAGLLSRLEVLSHHYVIVT